MKIVRWGELGTEKLGVVNGTTLLDASSITDFDHASRMTFENLKALTEAPLDGLPELSSDTRLGACVPRPGKFIGIGLNYSDHAAETGNPIPDDPIVFLKAPNCIVGPNDTVKLPAGSDKVDWEVELTVVIGTHAYQVPRDGALDTVLGYCVSNDLSARDWQFETTGQWTKGKSFPGAGPVGPWLVTPDEVGDLSDLWLELRVGDEVMQSGSTRHMIFDIPDLISRVSHYMALEPGDIIATGTPPGVGYGRSPRKFLAVGETVTAEIEGLGIQMFDIA